MPRFVILEHDFPSMHWDFMLEIGDTLRTWRLHGQPEPGLAIRAEPLGDHRKAYLDYEGPVSGNRGSVRRWDAGTFEWRMDRDEQVIVELHGAHCAGAATLDRLAGGEWRFSFAPGRLAS